MMRLKLFFFDAGERISKDKMRSFIQDSTPKTTRKIPHYRPLLQKNFHPNLRYIVVFNELRAFIFAYLYLPETVSH